MTPYFTDADADITIYHGDSTALLAALDPVDHVITDPPYEVDAHTKQRRIPTGGGSVDADPLDFNPISGNTRVICGAEFGRLARRWVLVFAQIEAIPVWRASCEASGRLVYRRTCAWVKPDAMPQLTGDRPGTGYEAILTMHAKGRSKWNGGGRSNVYTVPKASDRARNLHPTQKPIALMLQLIADFTNPGDLILDPFMGAGTTLVAAKQIGRRAIGIESDATYCAIAARRLAQGALPLMLPMAAALP